MQPAISLLNIPRIEIYKRLFQLGNYDFITIKDGKKHEKQEYALKCLTNNSIKEVGYGGAAGGAKSWTGCSWLAFMCLLYPGTRWFIGREELKRLRESTLITWYKVCEYYGIKQGELWKYNGQDHYIQFFNGSRIDLLELKELPSDPLFERYGSTEYTGGWIEEAGEVAKLAFETLKTRCGRQLNDKYGLSPKIYLTFNPKKNFVYSYFYKRDKMGELPSHVVFIKALLYDNPHRESSYEEQLKGIDSIAQKERLLNGNFDYDDDPSVLCDWNAITDCFTNEIELSGNDTKRLSADLAMKGRDRFVCGYMDGNIDDGIVIEVVIDKLKATGKSIETDLKTQMQVRHVGKSQTIVDSDGMGAYLESYLNGIVEFHGNASAFNVNEFAKIKDELGYKLAELINKRLLRIICAPEQRERIEMQLSVLKADNVDADTKKKQIIKKEAMKELIGCSPDYLDMLLMAMWFLCKPESARTHITRREAQKPKFSAFVYIQKRR